MQIKPYTTDTSSDAIEVQLGLWSKMTGTQRVQKTMAISSQIRTMAFDAIRRRHPDWNNKQVRLKFIELTYGIEIAKELEYWLAEQTVDQVA